jgi:hypothetical protein
MNSDTASQLPEDAVLHDAEGQDPAPLGDPLTGVSERLTDHHHHAAGAISAGTIGQAVGLAALNATAFLQNVETSSSRPWPRPRPTSSR